MRILIVHNILWAHYKSSVFQALQQLADQQPTISFKVLQIARNERTRASIKVVTNGQVPIYTYNYELLFDRFLEDIKLPERIIALIRRASAFKPDVITLTGYYDPAQVLLLLWAKRKGIKVIMQNESTAIDHVRGGWKERLKRWIINQCDGFFCFGTQSANYLIHLGVPPEKILLRKNAVDNNTLRAVYERALPNRVETQRQQGLRPNNVIFIGRLLGLKNLHRLVEAFSIALQQSAQTENWGLILLGEGPEYKPLSEQIIALGLENNIKLVPSRPWYEIPEMLALSNVLVLASLSETWGLVVNEAMACGLPVLVSNRCGCAHDLVKEGENGFIFDPLDHLQLTALLVTFMESKIDTQKMQASSRQIIAPYSPDNVALEMLNVMKKLVNGR